MARYRSFSVEFKRQVAQDYLGGEISLHSLFRRHRIARQLIRLWVKKYEAGEFSEDVAMVASREEYEARIA